MNYNIYNNNICEGNIMEKYKAIPQGYMTVGEVAKKMGLTVRALQYYDKEGLFSPSCISEGGRRLYSDKDIIKLHQILTLKSLGFSINEIKNNFTSIDTPQKAVDTLTEQSIVIKERINALSQSLQVIELLKAEIMQMQVVDFKKYADIIINLQMGNKYYRSIKYFDNNILDYCYKHFNKQNAPIFISKFNMILEKIDCAIKSNIMPDSEQGQNIAKEFWQLITEFFGGDMSMLSQLMNSVNLQVNGSEYNHMFSFIEPALGVYFNNLGINPFEVKNEKCNRN